jgi:hypothetical protein
LKNNSLHTASIFLRISFFCPNIVQPAPSLHFTCTRTNPPPQFAAMRPPVYVVSSIDCNFFHKLLPLKTEASILWRLVISPPPNCSPPPLLVYKMVANVMAPQDRPSSSEVIPATRSVAYHQHRKSLPVSSEVILATTFRTTRASISPSQAECHLSP